MKKMQTIIRWGIVRKDNGELLWWGEEKPYEETSWFYVHTSNGNRMAVGHPAIDRVQKIKISPL